MKLKSERFQHRSEGGEYVTFMSNVAIDPKGMFTFTIIEELVDVFKEVKESREQYKNSVELVYLRGSSIPAVKTAVKEVGLSFLKHLLVKFLECDKSEELVIRYAVHNHTLAAKDSRGNFYGSTYAAPSDEPATPHVGDNYIHACNKADFFYVGLNAGIFRKVTYKRGENVKIRYTPVCIDSSGNVKNNDDSILFSKGSYSAKLASFSNVLSENVSYSGRYEMKDIPYSEESARFFYELLSSICSLGQKVEKFFLHPELDKSIKAKLNGDDASLSLSSLI